jgi:ABC-type molybdate transport system ATPase subunit
MYAALPEHSMEQRLQAAFDQGRGCLFLGEAKGLCQQANAIKGQVHRPDIFIGVSPGVNQQLMGATSGNYVLSYVKTGYLPQRSALFPRLTVAQNITFGHFSGA